MTKSTTPVARIIDLTPEIAKDLLDRNPRNRKFSKANYETVRRAITLGEWVLNGEAIKVDTDGFVLDGQHRCRAVIETGVTIPTFLIENLPPSTQDTMDTGKTRSLGDILSIRGEVNTAALAALTRRLYIAKEYGLRAAIGSYGVATNKECLDFLAGNPWVREIVHPSRKVAVYAKLPAGLTGVLMVAFSEIDEEDSRFFFERLETGESLTADHPIFVLRKTLSILSETRGESSQLYLGAIAIKAWNKYRAGDHVGLLKFRSGGANPEAFPEPK